MDKTKVVQIGLLVRDIHKASADWASFLGCEIPEVNCTEGYKVSHAQYRGEPCHGRMDQAVFHLGELEIELISPAGAEPSFWKECLERDGEGLHHIAFRTREIERDMQSLADQGCEIVQKGSWPDTPRDGSYAYADASEKLKCIVELLDFPRESNRG